MDIRDNTEDHSALKLAVDLLESPSLLAKLSGFVSTPIEALMKVLPDGISTALNGAVKGALHFSAKTAIMTMSKTAEGPPSTKTHKLIAATSGLIGGAFGASAVLAELPISTTIMMRSVADVARSEGFDLSDFSTKQACIEVFALGGPQSSGDEMGYYSVRAFTASAMPHMTVELNAIATKQAEKMLNRMTPEQGGKALASLIEKVAEFFGIAISGKVAVQAAPIIGALSGATVNTLFTHHYQGLARGHFVIKRLEATYGFEHIKEVYASIKGGSQADS